jgi:hypothetical protein
MPLAARISRLPGKMSLVDLIPAKASGFRVDQSIVLRGSPGGGLPWLWMRGLRLGLVGGLLSMLGERGVVVVLMLLVV